MSELLAQTLVRRLLEITDLFSEEADKILDTLIEIGEPAIQPLIEDYLGCEDIYYGEEYTVEVGEALGKIGEPAIEALIVSLTTGNGNLQFKVACILGEIGDKRALEPLRKAFFQDELYSALFAIVQIGGEDEAPFLLELLDNNSFDRKTIIFWLGATESNLVFKPLADALNDSDSEIRHHAVWSIEGLNHPDIAQVLLPLLNDPVSSVRYATAYVLATKFKDIRTTPYYAQYLTHQHAHNRSMAVSVLGRIGAVQYEDDLYQMMMKDKDKYVRLDCAVALIALEVSNTKKAEKLILKSITHRQGYIRFRAIQSVSILRPSLALPWLLISLKDKDAYNRFYSAQLLGMIGNIEALESLHASLSRESHRITKKAMQEAITKLES